MATRRARSNKFSAGITWKEVRRSLRGVLSWFLRVTWFVDYINPLRIYTRWRRRGCIYDSEGSVVVFKQTLTQRIKDSFVTESTRRRRLLDWVQSLVPAMDINDFSSSWTNGVALCALIDALVPGACPELSRLKPYHKLNNIRLAIKLANKFFSLPINAFRAEEIAIYGSHQQRRVYELLTVIRMLHARASAPADGSRPSWAFGRAPTSVSGNGEGEATPADQQGPSSSVVYCRNIARLCRIRKSGYQTGTVGKVFTLDIWLPDGLNPDGIRVDVAPMEEEEEVGGFILEEEISESIVDGLSGIPVDPRDSKINEGGSEQKGEFSGQSTGQSTGQFNGQFNGQSTGQFNGQSTGQFNGQFNGQSTGQFNGQFNGQSTGQALRSAKEDSSNVPAEHVQTATSVGNNSQRANKETVSDGLGVKTAAALPVDRSLENGLLRVRFCPAFVGRYQARARFGEADVEGSPMVVSVSPDFGAESASDEPSRKRLTFAEAAEIIIAKARNSRIYRQLLQNETTPSAKNSIYDVAAAVLRRTSKVKRTLAFRGHRSQSIINSEKAVVKRRTILKQMITRGGQEIVIERASTSIDEPNHQSAAATSFSLGVPGPSELSECSGIAPGSACIPHHMDGEATGGGERVPSGGKPRCYLAVPRSNDDLLICSSLSSAVEDPQREDLFETKGIAWKSAEPRRSGLTSSEKLCSTRTSEDQDVMIPVCEKASKDGEPACSRSTEESTIPVVMEDGVFVTDGCRTRVLRDRRDLDDGQKCDEEADHLASDRRLSESDARSRRNHFKTSSVKETSLARQHRKQGLDVPDDDVSLLGGHPSVQEMENKWKVTTESFDGVVSTPGPTNECVDSNGCQLHPPSKHPEGDSERGKGKNGEHWPVSSALFDQLTTDSLVLEMSSASCGSRRGSFARQDTVQSIEPDVHSAAFVLPQQEGHDNSSGKDEEEKDISRNRGRAEERSQPHSREPSTKSTASLPFVLTMDSWTQVKYEEIKEATGWKRPVRRVSPRKRTGVAVDVKPIHNDDEGGRIQDIDCHVSNSGKHSKSEPSRKSELLHDKTETECNELRNLLTAFSPMAESGAAPYDTKRRSSPAGLSGSRSAKNTTRKGRRHSLTQFEEGRRYPQLEWSTSSRRSKRRKRRMLGKASGNTYPSIHGLQSHPVSQRWVDCDQQMDVSTVRRGSCSGDRVLDRSDSECDLGRGSSGGGGVSDLRKLDDFFAFLDQFANGHQSSQRRQEVTVRRLSAESLGREGRSSEYGSVSEFNARENSVAASGNDFTLALLGRAAGEEGSEEDRSQSVGGEVWGDATGGGSSGEEDDEDVDFYSIYRMCTAFGPGLNEGTVGRLNYFQVRILTKRQGHLTIEMSGHRRHSVLEQNVTYIGDNVYDVTYEVSNPGVYAIAVKWSSCHVRGSPFVCTVSI